jgi:hypothetical protein
MTEKDQEILALALANSNADKKIDNKPGKKKRSTTLNLGNTVLSEVPSKSMETSMEGKMKQVLDPLYDQGRNKQTECS